MKRAAKAIDVCIVCHAAVSRSFLCKLCARNYDYACNKDDTVYGVIRWAVARARRELPRETKR